MTAIRRTDTWGLVTAIAPAIAIGSVIGFGYWLPTIIGLAAIPVSIAALWALTKDIRVVPFWCACGAVAMVCVNGMRVGPSATYGDLLIVGATVTIGVIALIRPSTLPTPPAWLVAGAMLLLVSALIVEMFPAQEKRAFSIFTNTNLLTNEITEESSMRLALKLIFALTIAPYVIASTVVSWRGLRFLVAAWLAGVGASALVAVLAALAGVDLQETLVGNAYSVPGRYTGLTVHPVALGITCAMALPVALSQVGSKDPRRAWAFAALVALYGSAILVSGTRAALLAAVAGGVYVAAAQPATRGRLVAIATVGLAVAYLYAPSLETLSLPQRLSGEASSSQTSNTAHLTSISDGFNLWLERPIGWSFETVRGAHNIVLQMLTSGGLLALAGFGLVIRASFMVSRQLARCRRLPEDMRVLAVALTASLLVWFGQAMVASASFDRYLYIPTALLLAMFFIAERQNRLG